MTLPPPVLGMTGAALQATFANPLASPDITGSSSGAALGAVAGSYWLGITGPLALAACGAAGAALALAALFAIAGRRSETATLLLAGIAIALAAGAGASLLLALAPSPFAFYDSFEWLMGSFVDRSLPQAAAALIPAAIACGLLASRSKALDMMALGDDVAASVGHRPRRLAVEVVALSAIAVGACVSVCGAIAFVGLIAPYAARAITCAQEIALSAKPLGLDIRAGLHTGEVELRGDDITGLGVVIARRVCDHAAADELLASRTVKDLVIGSGIGFVDRGVHTLKGVPDDWQLYAVSS